METNEVLGWRIYVHAKDWDIYAYTVIGAKGEAEAKAIVKSLCCTGGLKLRAVLATLDRNQLPPPELQSV